MPTCTATPNPAVVGASYWVTASNFPTGVRIAYTSESELGTSWSYLGNLPKGTITLEQRPVAPSTVTFRFYAVTSPSTVSATCSVTVD